jgi:hypothetical protein
LDDVGGKSGLRWVHCLYKHFKFLSKEDDQTMSAPFQSISTHHRKIRKPPPQRKLPL